MAVFTKFWGAARGKVGGIVLSKGDKGMVYGRAYQPQVANPKTKGQTDQRSKMNLAGKVSKATPSAVLIGMPGSNARERRSVFSRNILRSITLDNSTPNEVVATLAPDQIQFSQGDEICHTRVSTPAAVTANRVSIGLSSDDTDGYGERVVFAIIDPIEKGGYSQIAYTDVLFTSAAEVQVAIDLPNPLEDRSMVCVYRLPYRLNPAGMVDLSSLYTNGENILAKSVLSASLVKAWGDSVHTDDVVFTQA